MNNARSLKMDVSYNKVSFAERVGADIESMTYVAQVEIPAKEYKETEIPAPVAEEGEATGGMNNMPGIERTPLPLNTDDVTLYLFAIDGIYIC